MTISAQLEFYPHLSGSKDVQVILRNKCDGDGYVLLSNSEIENYVKTSFIVVKLDIPDKSFI